MASTHHILYPEKGIPWHFIPPNPSNPVSWWEVQCWFYVSVVWCLVIWFLRGCGLGSFLISRLLAIKGPLCSNPSQIDYSHCQSKDGFCCQNIIQCFPDFCFLVPRGLEKTQIRPVFDLVTWDCDYSIFTSGEGYRSTWCYHADHCSEKSKERCYTSNDNISFLYNLYNKN